MKHKLSLLAAIVCICGGGGGVQQRPGAVDH